jgi:hypothetical protein
MLMKINQIIFKSIISGEKSIIVHTLIGVAAGYFLLHPITMVIYWFEISGSAFTLPNVLKAFVERFQHAFHIHMMPMSLSFIFIGGLFGLISGLYSVKIRKQDLRLQLQGKQLKENVRSIISNGENENVEFKRAFRYDHRIGQPKRSMEDIFMQSVASFMNRKGGLIIVGVDSNGYIKGLADDYFSLGNKSREGFEIRFIEAVASRLGADACSFVHLTFFEISDMDICTVSIDKTPRPIYIREGESTIFYLRTGKTNRKLNTRETVEYLKVS